MERKLDPKRCELTDKLKEENKDLRIGEVFALEEFKPQLEIISIGYNAHSAVCQNPCHSPCQPPVPSYCKPC